MEERKVLKVGKLDNETLKRMVIDKIRYKSDQVIVKAGVGEDCAYLDYGEECCVLSTDPITASVKEIGRLAIHVSCNDVATTGVRPFALLLTLMLPVGSTLEDVETIMAQAAKEAETLQVEIAGGHTEVTPAVAQPVIVATALGKVPKNNLLAREGILPGDHLVLTKSIGLEGTAILATDHVEELHALLTDEELSEAIGYAAMTDVVAEGAIAGSVGVSAMHDVTEGGILGAVWELCTVSETGVLVREEDIPVTEVVQKVCRHFGIDYRKLISSGSMLIVVREEKTEKLLSLLKEAGIPAADIGTMLEKEAGMMMETDGEKSEIPAPKSDEIYKVVGQ